jgi:hypothetical protein
MWQRLQRCYGVLRQGERGLIEGEGRKGGKGKGAVRGGSIYLSRRALLSVYLEVEAIRII